MLGRRAHSSGDLLKKLAEKGYGEEDAAAAVGRCAELGYVNDAEYAARAAERLRERGYGPRKIAEHLEGRGVERETAREAVSAADWDETPAALAALIAKIHRGEWSPKEKKRCADTLARKGFAWDDIGAAIRAAASGADDDG